MTATKTIPKTIRLRIVHHCDNPTWARLPLSPIGPERALGFHYRATTKVAKSLSILTGDPIERVGIIYVIITRIKNAKKGGLYTGEGRLLSGHDVLFYYDTDTREGTIALVA